MNLKGEHIKRTHSKSPDMRNVCDGHYFQSKFCHVVFFAEVSVPFIVVYVSELITDSWLLSLVCLS